MSIRITDIGGEGGWKLRLFIPLTSALPSFPAPIRLHPYPERGNEYVSGTVRSFAPLASMHTDPKIEWRNTEPLGANEAVVSG